MERARRRFHPLHHLRTFPPVKWVRERIDRPWLVRIEGVPHPVTVRLGRNLSTVLSFGMAEEREERDLLARLARVNTCRVFWDVGANYGLYAFSLRASVPDLLVEAFEPDPDCIALLHRTLKLGGSDRVRVHPIALSDELGSMRFRRDLATGSTGSLLARDHSSDDASDPTGDSFIIDVMASTIDAESDRLGIPDLIKIDVEGAELAVLRGARETLRSHVPIILLECTERQDDVRRLLEELGYEIRDPRSPGERVGGPGMPFMALALDPQRHVLGETAGPR